MLSGKTVIITGGAGGIGEAIARTAYREGANVVIGDVRLDAAQAVADSLGEKAIAVLCDVRNDSDLEILVETAVQHFGRIDGLVNNAGINWVKPFLDTTPEEWQLVIDTDLRPTFFLTQRVCRVLLRQQPATGSIVNIASVHAVAGYPRAAPYDAAKAGVVGMTRSLAVEMGSYGIRINALSPGLVETQIYRDILAASPDREANTAHWHSNIPLQRGIQPSEIAELAVFLLSERASAITGANLLADAGMTAQLVSREPDS
ncbi:MAG: short-chain dehydrogenase [Chthonomonadales bacterium]|nr:short-chain dehydrogenase [Chthonomonadales bacterium]